MSRGKGRPASQGKRRPASGGKERLVSTAAVAASVLVAAIIVGPLALPDLRVLAQANPAPINTPPDPYRPVENWAQLGRVWGATSAVDVDRSGHVWVADRCGANSCAGSDLAPVL